MTYRIVTLLSAILLLTACSPKDNEPAAPLFQGQKDALDKAKGLDAELQKQEEERKRALEQQAQ